MKKLTEKQILRIQNKIKKIRQGLAAEKRIYGCYDDSAGRRYNPLTLYIKIQDYKGGLNYTRWFDKNFPDDIGEPLFLFEWIIILFKNGKIKDAEKKAIETYCSNVYLLDRYFERPLKEKEIYHGSNWESVEFAEHVVFIKDDPELFDFEEWLKEFTDSKKFIETTSVYLDLRRQLLFAEGYEERHKITQQEQLLLSSI